MTLGTSAVVLQQEAMLHLVQAFGQGYNSLSELTGCFSEMHRTQETQKKMRNKEKSEESLHPFLSSLGSERENNTSARKPGDLFICLFSALESQVVFTCFCY